MKVRFWGVRGSYPVPGAETVRYGGNTSCIEVRLNDGTLIILDAGTGIVPLGASLMQEEFGKGAGKAAVFLTHTHWDHIMGMPFFAPASVSGNEFSIYARKRASASLEELFVSQQAPEYFEKPFAHNRAKFAFHEITEGDVISVGSAKVSCARLNHPCYALAYRVDGDSGSVVYVTDTSSFKDILIEEAFIKNPADAVPAPGTPGAATMAKLADELVKLLGGADLVIYDTFHEPEGYKLRPHWGHSTPDHGISDCAAAKARRMALFHHAPDNTDDTMDRLEAKYREKGAEVDVDVFAAKEGLTVSVP